MTGSRPQSPIHAKNFHTINRPSSAQITPPINSHPIKPTVTPQFRPASAHATPKSPVSNSTSKPILKPVTSPLAKDVPLAPKWPQQQQ